MPYATLLLATRCARRCAKTPDVVLIGEMRDLETIEAALRIAETGHLTFGTLGTPIRHPRRSTAALSMSFRRTSSRMIRAQLSLVLEGILCQALLPRADGKGRGDGDGDSYPQPCHSELDT